MDGSDSHGRLRSGTAEHIREIRNWTLFFDADKTIGQKGIV